MQRVDLSLPCPPGSPIPAGGARAPCSVVAEAGHGEGTSKGLHALAQVSQAALRLRVLQQEGLEVLELTWRQRGRW